MGNHVSALSLQTLMNMEFRDQGRGGDETGRRVEQLEKQLDVYRRLYRGAVESLKVMRRRQAAAKPAEPAS